MTAPEDVQLRCGATAGSCKCRHEPGHEGPHECTDNVCNGAWKGGSLEADDFEAVRFPDVEAATGVPVSEFLLGALFGGGS